MTAEQRGGLAISRRLAQGIERGGLQALPSFASASFRGKR